MSKTGISLSILLVMLAGAYICWFTDLFRKQSIQIIPVLRPGTPSTIPPEVDGVPVLPVVFGLKGKFALTQVKVVNPQELATNKNAQPLWHLVSDSNSPPVPSITYGGKIPGMRPAVPGTAPQPLSPDVPYQLQIEAGKVRGETNFVTREHGG